MLDVQVSITRWLCSHHGLFNVPLFILEYGRLKVFVFIIGARFVFFPFFLSSFAVLVCCICACTVQNHCRWCL